MLPAHTWPAHPVKFVPQNTGGKVRIFTLHDESEYDIHLEAVTTVSDPDAGIALTRALNDAATTGDRTDVQRLTTDMPEAVRVACHQALDSVPPASAIAVADTGWPMRMLLQTLHSSPEDVAATVDAAMDLCLQVLAENYTDKYGLHWSVRIFSGEATVGPNDEVAWWPSPDSTLLDRSHPNPNDLSEALADAPWETHRCRLHWVWVADTDDLESDHSAQTELVLECFDEPPFDVHDEAQEAE